jgi:Ca-activated chloride channel homolog
MQSHAYFPNWMRRALVNVALSLGALCLLAGIMVSCAPTAPAPLLIHIVYGSEKQAWLEPLIQEFNGSQSRIRVQGTPTGSIESIRAILEEVDTPTVWAPASSFYLPLANEEWQQIYGVDLLEGTPNSLVLSPVVIAMWRDMAEALGWPHKAVGWSDIARLTTSEQGWAEYGRAEWGAFKFGHTNPESSTSGLISILGLAYAATGKNSNLTASDLQNPELRRLVEQVLTRVSQYGRSTGFFAERMFHCQEGGTAYLSAAILYENLVVAQEQKRLQGQGCEAQHPSVVSIYPAEGTFWSDNPYIILNAPWTTAEQIAAARDFEAFLLAAPQQQQAIDYGFRPADPAIPLTSPLDRQHGMDPTQPQITLQNPSATIIRELQKLWATS